MAEGEPRVIPWECPVVNQQGSELESAIADRAVSQVTFVCTITDCEFSDTYIKEPEPGVFPIQTRGGRTTKCDMARQQG